MRTQWEWNGKRRLSAATIVVWDDKRWNGSPVFNKHKSIGIVDDKQQCFRI